MRSTRDLMTMAKTRKPTTPPTTDMMMTVSVLSTSLTGRVLEGEHRDRALVSLTQHDRVRKGKGIYLYTTGTYTVTKFIHKTTSKCIFFE